MTTEQDTAIAARDAGAQAAIEMAGHFQEQIGPFAVETAHGVIEALACAIALWAGEKEAVARLEAVIREVKVGTARDRATMN